MEIRHFSQAAFAIVMAAALAGCGNARDATPAASVQGRQPASETAQRMSGLSHMPRPENAEALDRSLARHFPHELARGRARTLVLVDVHLDAQGRVLDVTPAARPAGAPETVSIVLTDYVPGSSTPVQRTQNGTYDPAFAPAARAALREVRFQPALRDGKPVPFTMRMTVEFISPDAS